MTSNHTDFRIAYVLHNNILQMLKARPICNGLPEHWPRALDATRTETGLDLDAHLGREVAITSANVNILLCLAAYTESDLEEILLAAFPHGQERAEFDDRAVSILRSELIKLSSLERYFEFFQKLYGKHPRELLCDQTKTGVRLLFDLRNIVIHASALAGQWHCKDGQHYLMVDDPFYLSAVRTSAKLLGLPDTFYCLPESLLGCNQLIDILIQCAGDAISFLSRYVVEHWPDCKIAFHLPYLVTDALKYKASL